MLDALIRIAWLAAIFGSVFVAVKLMSVPERVDENRLFGNHRLTFGRIICRHLLRDFARQI